MSDPGVDVLVAGGGPAGLATALALRASGLRVTIAETSGYQGCRVGEHLDSSALPLLRRLGLPVEVWQTDSLECPGVCSRWGGGDETFSSTLTSPFGAGLILDRPAFDARFAAAVADQGVELVAARTGAVERPAAGDAWRVTLRRPGAAPVVYLARFLVDATGRGAHLARLLGARPIVYDDLVGLVARLERTPGAGPDDACLHVEAMPTGWWYTAPLSDGRMVAAFMTDADLLGTVAARHRLWEESFAASDVLRGRTAPGLPEPGLTVRSARSQRLGQVACEGWLAVGDAAIGFDPLSSAGIRKGLELGLLAAEAIRKHLQGDREALGLYERHVQGRFDDYLLTRARYYRLEHRWPGEPFWRRRRLPLATEIPVRLSPATPVGPVCPVEEVPAPVIAPLRETFPAIDLQLLLTLARDAQTVGELAGLYRDHVGCRYLDQDVVAALQRLCEIGLLGQGRQPPPLSQIGVKPGLD